MRKLWLTLHLYLGLSAGLVFVLSGLTGSLLVFYLEIDEWLNPQLVNAQPSTPWRSYEEIFQSLRAAHPERDGPWRLEIPTRDGAPVMARYYNPEEKKHLLFAPLMVAVNPATAEVLASRFWGEFAMTWIYDLHYTLLMDRAGRTVLGIIGILLCVSLVTGVYLWWPSRERLRAALTLKRGAGSERLVFDLHKLNGIYGLLLTMTLIVTGIFLALPDYAKPLVNEISPLYQAPSARSEPNGAARVTLDEAVAVARTQFPGATLKWIETPNGAAGSIRINLGQQAEPSHRFPRTNVWIDQYSGKVIAVRDPLATNSAGDTFFDWLHPLHNGEAFGITGRILVFISGLVPLVLFVTGFLRWRQKKKAETRREMARATQVAATSR